MRTEAILDLLDSDLDSLGKGDRTTGMSGKLTIPGLSPEDIQSLKVHGNNVAALALETTSKEYVTLHRCKNVISNSILGALHACPRKFIQEKIAAAEASNVDVARPPNIDFVFGHSVGAGVASYLAFDRDLTAGIFATVMSWYGDWDLGKEDYNKRKKKSIERAVIATEMFSYWWKGNFDEWEIYRLSDGRPCVELSFCIDFGKTKYFGHIDCILRNRRTKRIAIGENKTTGYSNPNPALYQNSGQAIGYALVLDLIVKDLADYDVLYYAYSATGEEWHHFPFAKTTAMKLEWIQDRLIDISHINQYYRLEHFPKDGSSCFLFNRQCQFFGECDIVNKERMRNLEVLETEDRDTYPVDYYFDVTEMIEEQKGRAMT